MEVYMITALYWLVAMSYRILLGIPRFDYYSSEYSDASKRRFRTLYQGKENHRLIFGVGPVAVPVWDVFAALVAAGILGLFVLLGFAMADATGTFFSLLLYVLVPLELVSLYSLYGVLKHLPGDRTELIGKVYEVMQADELDRDQAQYFFDHKDDWIKEALEQYAPEADLRVGEEGEQWRVVRVHYHKGDQKSLVSRDVTITFSNGDRSIVTVLPSMESVRSWVDAQYAQFIKERELEGTHLGDAMKGVKPSQALFSSERSTAGMLDFVGELETSAVRLAEDALPAVTLYGSPTEDGSYLLHGIDTAEEARTLIPLNSVKTFLQPVAEVAGLSREGMQMRLAAG